MYGSKPIRCSKATATVVASVRKSKTGCYEIPYIVKGSITQTGSEELPKSICTDKTIGT